MDKIIKLDFSTKTKTADTLQNLQVSVNALRHGSITGQGKEFLCLAVEDYIKIKQAQTGRPRIHETDAAKSKAWRESKKKLANK